ncbi:MAG: hypothetical protein JNM29_08190 [Candidatus Odyssella sp.]|nr:hypothetical protein [Candidatus Odyssella sp.]
MRSRIAFLSRLVALKLAALFAFVLLSLYTPSTTNALLDGAGEAAKLVASGTEASLQSLGTLLGDAALLMPKKGAVELTMRYVGMDKVLLFVGITIALYLAWLAAVAGARGAWRSLDAAGSPRARRDARLQSGPPR